MNKFESWDLIKMDINSGQLNIDFRNSFNHLLLLYLFRIVDEDGNKVISMLFRWISYITLHNSFSLTLNFSISILITDEKKKRCSLFYSGEYSTIVSTNEHIHFFLQLQRI